MAYKTPRLIVVTVAIIVVIAASAFGDDYYVDGTNGTDDTSHGGSTGTGAWKTVTYALAQVTGSSANPHTIHIAAGTYTPHTNGEAFPLTMEDYVSLSGEDQDTTILDAWRGANHVLYCDNVDDSTIENLTIKGGYTHSANQYTDTYGAGLFCNYSSPTLANCTITGNEVRTYGWAGVGGGMCCLYSSPTLTNCTISGNRASEDGGGIAWFYGSPTLINCTISGNYAPGWGGGIRGAYSSAVLTGCTISGNAVNWDGGGIYFSGESYPTLTNCSISGNSARSYDGGGIYCRLYASPRLTNCSITNNSGRYGGGMCCWSSGWATLINCTMIGNAATSGGAVCCLGDAAPTLANCTLSANSASYGGAIYSYNSDSHPTIRNSILWGDSPNEIEGYTSGFSVTYSDVEGGWSGTGNINEDPEFIVGYYLSQTASGETTDSPCVDSGSDTAANLGLDDRNTRTDGVNDSGQVDMGYHYDVRSESTDYYVDKDNGDDTNDGLSWASAFATVQQGLDSCTTGSGANSDIVHVAAQTYHQNIVLNSSYIRLLGGYPPGGGDRDPAANETIIDGGAVDPVVTLESKTQVLIDGFTIQNGSAPYGGGIHCYDSDATVTGCTISACTADEFGGAVYFEASSVYLSNCIIMNSAAELGGGIYCRGSDVNVTGCTISGCTADQFGGAIYFEASSAEMSNCTIMDNTAQFGGGMFCYDDSCVGLLNCLIVQNVADYGAAAICYWESSLAIGSCTIADNSDSLGVGGVHCEAAASFEAINSILFGNSSEQISGSPLNTFDITYSCIEGGYSGEGNIDEEPLFVPTDDPPFEYYLAHTGAQAGDSPCLDAGCGDVADYGLAGTTTCTDGREDGDDDGDGGTGPIDMGYHYPEGYDGQGDTSINLTSFEARPAGSAILVTWETGAEIDNAGFVLFREIAGTQDYWMISDLIPSEGSASSGTSYIFTDAEVEPGITYNYWLVDIETSGNWTAHGPASVTTAGIIPYLDPGHAGIVLR